MARADEAPEITPRSRIDLGELGISLCFHADEIVFDFSNAQDEARYFITPIQYFICYRTFINYNIMSVVGAFDSATFPLVEAVEFRRVESTEVISQNAIASYLRVLNEPLHYAIAFYLIGCENLRYFLMEYYKAVEVIENELGGERQCLDVLGCHGVDRAAVKEFKAICNDMRRAPLDIGRHAPARNAPLYSVDLRNLLGQPKSRDVFERATLACRQVIDGYLKLLETSA